jgi:hypothetical protein
LPSIARWGLVAVHPVQLPGASTWVAPPVIALQWPDPSELPEQPAKMSANAENPAGIQPVVM